MAKDRQEKIKRVIDKRQKGVIVLENIADPHNAAAVWRSAEAFEAYRPSAGDRAVRVLGFMPGKAQK